MGLAPKHTHAHTHTHSLSHTHTHAQVSPGNVVSSLVLLLDDHVDVDAVDVDARVSVRVKIDTEDSVGLMKLDKTAVVFVIEAHELQVLKRKFDREEGVLHVELQMPTHSCVSEMYAVYTESREEYQPKPPDIESNRWIYIHVHTSTHIHTHTYVCANVCLSVCLSVCLCVHVCVCQRCMACIVSRARSTSTTPPIMNPTGEHTFMYTRLHIHTRTHTCVYVSVCLYVCLSLSACMCVCV